MNLHIRKMQESDIDSVYNIETNTHISPWDKKIIQDCFLIGYDCQVIVLNHSLIVGYSITRIAKNTAHILNFCIDKPQHSKGLGKIMLAHLIAEFEDRALHDIQLEVRCNNTIASHLYHSFGFEQVDIKKNYYLESDIFTDAIVLSKKLRA